MRAPSSLTMAAAAAVAILAAVPLLGFAGAGGAAALGVVGLLLLALWRPELSLALLVGSLPLFGAAPGGPRLAWAEVQVLALLVGYALRVGAGRERLLRSALDGPIAVWLGVSLASLVPLRFHPPSLAADSLLALLRHLFDCTDTGPWFVLRAAGTTLSAAALAWLTGAIVRERGAGLLLRVLAVSVLSTSLLGLAEVLGWLSLRPLRPVHPLYADRLHSVFHHPAWLAQFLLLSLPWVATRLEGTGRVERWLSLLAVLSGSLCIVLTLQRGAWFAFAASLATAAWLVRRRLVGSPRRLAAAALLAVLLLALPAALSAPVRARTRELFSDMSNRSLFWAPVAAMVRNRPLLGQGLGTFAWLYPEFQPVESPDYLVFHGEAHNAYLMVLAERGVLGLLAYLWLLGALGWLGWKSGSRAALIMAVAIAVYGLGQYLFYVRGVELMAWIGIGLGLARRMPVEAEGTPPGPRPARRLVLAGAIGLLVLVLARATGPGFPASPDDRTFGLHLTEGNGAQSFRWTDERADLSLLRPGTGGVLAFELADGGRSLGGATPGEPLAVAIEVDGELRERALLAGDGFQPLLFWVSGRPAPVPILLSLRPERTFRPAERSDTPDTRRLGVALRGPSLRALRAGELAGFYPIEEDEGILFRWSRGRRGVIAVGDRSGTLVLVVRAADPSVSDRPAELVARVSDGRTVRLALGDREWHELEIRLGEAAELTVVELEIARGWRPVQSGLSRDSRELGFGLARWKVRP